MGIDRQLSIPLFHPPTAGDNRYRCAVPQPIGRPVGTFNRPYCPRCRALWRGIFDRFGAKRHVPSVRLELNNPRGVARELAQHVLIRHCLSLLFLKSLRWTFFATRWCEGLACSVLDRLGVVWVLLIPRITPYLIGFRANNMWDMMVIDTDCEPQWVGSGVYR